jgi:hypothetical protein
MDTRSQTRLQAHLHPPTGPLFPPVSTSTFLTNLELGVFRERRTKVENDPPRVLELKLEGLGTGVRADEKVTQAGGGKGGDENGTSERCVVYSISDTMPFQNTVNTSQSTSRYSTTVLQTRHHTQTAFLQSRDAPHPTPTGKGSCPIRRVH